MLLEDVTEYESTPEGRRITKLDQILLNGNNITMVNVKIYICIRVVCIFILAPVSDPLIFGKIKICQISE
jgi:hypothetical protein